MEAGRGRRERGVAKKCMPFVRVRARTELRPLSPSSSPALMGGGRCNVVNCGRLWWTANCPPSRRVSGASEPGLLARACPAAAAGPEPPRPRVPASPPCGRERCLNFHYPPTCVHLVHPLSRPCPPPAPACIVLPRAAPRCAGARTPRTGYCGRRRRSDRPFRTGLQRWLEEEEILSQAPVFHEFLESIYLNFKVLIWTESSILAQDERWRRA